MAAPLSLKTAAASAARDLHEPPPARASAPVPLFETPGCLGKPI